jgi:hypothetical protein
VITRLLVQCGCLSSWKGCRGTCSDFDEEWGRRSGCEQGKEETWVEISQGNGVVEALSKANALQEEFLSTLGIGASGLAPVYDIQNSKTSRVKTTIPLKSAEVLDCLRLHPKRSKVCANALEAQGCTNMQLLLAKGKMCVLRGKSPKIRGMLRMQLPEVSSFRDTGFPFVADFIQL